MADEFATPVSKLQQVSSRDADGPKLGATDMPSYEDILRNSVPDQQQQSYHGDVGGGPGSGMMMHAPPGPSGGVGGMHMDISNQQGYVDHAPMNYAPHHDQHRTGHREYAPDDTPHRHKDEGSPEPTKKQVAPSGWRGLLHRHKADIIIALVIFTIIVFVLPRIRAMPRFQMSGVPTYVIALISVASGCIGNSIVLAMS